jgi:exodeoxyribonuclease VII large subunit
MPTPERDVYTVGRLNREVRLLIEHGMPTLWVEGELTNFSRPASGHWYFTLKDRDAQVRCTMFRQRNAALRFVPRDGQLVMARVRVGLYEPRGEYQLQVEHLEDSGVGALRREFDRLKEKLQAEGLLASALKRPLPTLPTRIGVITSPTGAAIRDILHILARRFASVPVVIYPTAVQGKDAVPQLLAALSAASSRQECDVLIVARGGGSMEDLWAFNDEAVARAIRAAPMPVVTGIGHEIDFTIADFVADVRAPTPSGAAELVVPDSSTWRNTLVKLSHRLQQTLSRRLLDDRSSLQQLRRRLEFAHPGQRVNQGAQKLDELMQRLSAAWALQSSQRATRLHRLEMRLSGVSPRHQLESLRERLTRLDHRLQQAWLQEWQARQQRLALASRTLNAVSPLAVLDRGYALVTLSDSGRLVRKVSEAPIGSIIEARLAHGQLRAQVISPKATSDEDSR